MAPDPDEGETITEDLFGILTGDLPRLGGASLAERLQALDAGRLESVYSAGELSAEDLDSALAGMIETAEYEREAELAQLGAMISSFEGPADSPRGRQLSVLIEHMVDELREEPTGSGRRGPSSPPDPATADRPTTSPPPPPLEDWPAVDTAEMVLDPTEITDSISRRRAPVELSLPESPWDATPREREPSVAILIEDVAPEPYDANKVAAELSELSAALAEWSTKSAAEILGVGGVEPPEIRDRLHDLRERYAPKGLDAPEVRMKKHEVLAVLIHALGTMSEAEGGGGVSERHENFARLALRRPTASGEEDPVRARRFLGVARAMVRGADYRSAHDALDRARESAAAVSGIVEVWRAYVRALSEKDNRVSVEIARHAIEHELAGSALSTEDRAEANLLLGRVYRRLDRPAESHEAFKRAYLIDPNDPETAKELDESIEHRRRNVLMLREALRDSVLLSEDDE
ncbi:MAG: hypothetical protein HY791_04315 [Deltaproteobacteria bacterium]|nr:hypothetical protein [Deltaproteobacteria bacterium]